MQSVRNLEIETPHGRARVHLHVAAQRRAALVLGHGAAGGITSPDLAAATDAGLAEGACVALVEQPYKVAGRRSPAPPRQLDAAWTAVVDHLRAGEWADLSLIVGGRSLGARVACRTAEATGAVAVLCLAFPVHPPGRPDASRMDELDAVRVPTLVVQGDRDPFGMPPPGERREVVRISGDHSLKTDVDAVAAAVRAWLPSVIAEPSPQRVRG
jgi:predicted alpha/beta-hydrolase family hydrolase